MWEVFELVMEIVERVSEKFLGACDGGTFEDGLRVEEEVVIFLLDPP